MATVKLSIKLKDKQVEILDACEIGNGIQYVVVCTGRQVGKTTNVQVVIYKWATAKSDYHIGVFLPSYKQCKHIFNRMTKMLKCFGKDILYNKSEYTITFENGSVIQFLTADNDNCRGFTFDAIVVDEACFVKDNVWQEAIQATVAVSLSKLNEAGEEGFSGKVLLTSTPKTKNWFYGMVNDTDDRTKVVTFTSEEGGIISKTILDKIKRQIPDSIWRNEYMGEFLDSGAGLFKYIPCIKDATSIKDMHGVVAGLDLGAKDDYTVLTIMNRNGELIYINRWNKQEWHIIMETVIIELKKYGSPIVSIESNGLGQVAFDEMKRRYGKVKEWITTNKSKNEMIQKLILDFNTSNLTILDVDYLKDELDFFSVDYKNGKAIYGGSNGVHDDCVMSLAMCNVSRAKVVTVTPSTFGTSIGR